MTETDSIYVCLDDIRNVIDGRVVEDKDMFEASVQNVSYFQYKEKYDGRKDSWQCNTEYLLHLAGSIDSGCFIERRIDAGNCSKINYCIVASFFPTFSKYQKTSEHVGVCKEL